MRFVIKLILPGSELSLFLLKESHDFLRRALPAFTQIFHFVIWISITQLEIEVWRALATKEWPYYCVWLVSCWNKFHFLFWLLSFNKGNECLAIKGPVPIIDTLMGTFPIFDTPPPIPMISYEHVQNISFSLLLLLQNQVKMKAWSQRRGIAPKTSTAPAPVPKRLVVILNYKVLEPPKYIEE